MASTALVTQGPVDASATRDAIVNNLTHLHDVSGQIVANFAKEPAAYWTQASPSTSVLQRLDGLPPSRFLIRALPDRSFLLTVYCKVSISVAGTATFRLALLSDADAITAPLYLASSTLNVTEFTTTSTSAAAVTATSIWLTPAQLAACRRPVPTLLADGTTPGSAYGFEVSLGVWAKSSAGAPRLHGLMAREFIGGT